ncbi:hypothetical protein J2Y66_001994 [Paenarthrobacter nitroguajacolicus]|uniref:hypothetical protein n=1 Tax=Paenarthrobacter nitroguajacolicus TaxID=211146 RepID=UPI00286040E6|nr:hypothetical protein [Paenarthrobacter nitroguajacolicus]MDR6987512.1 hypothetical protein [Paenarthrobacter nitroguajacolicus]
MGSTTTSPTGLLIFGFPSFIPSTKFRALSVARSLPDDQTAMLPRCLTLADPACAEVSVAYFFVRGDEFDESLMELFSELGEAVAVLCGSIPGD